MARSLGVEPGRVIFAAAPLVWGCAAPALSLLIDPFVFRSSAVALGAAGVALAATRSLARLELAPIGAPQVPRDAGRWLATGLAILLPLALLAAGWSGVSGDEPHYLVVAHSLVVDGDIDVANEYHDRAYDAVHPSALSPHSKPGLKPDSRYSMHGVGLPVLLAPAYALGRQLDPSWAVALPRALLAVLYGLFAWALYGLVAEVASAPAARRATPGTDVCWRRSCSHPSSCSPRCPPC